MWVLKVGAKYFCNEEETGQAYLGDLQDEGLCTWSSREGALKSGIVIFNDPHCIKFQVEEKSKAECCR